MNRIDDLHKQLCGVEQKIDKLSLQRSKIRKEIAVLACPYSVGDILVITNDDSDYIDSKFKPYIGFSAVVSDIRAYSETWEIVISILNKDKSPSAKVKIKEMTVRSTRFLTKQKEVTQK